MAEPKGKPVCKGIQELPFVGIGLPGKDEKGSEMGIWSSGFDPV